MKAFKKDADLHDDTDIKLNTAMRNAVAKNIQTPEFCGLELFREFRKERFRDYFIDTILEDGHADLVHIDNAYKNCAIVDSEHGRVLTIGLNCPVKALSDLYESLQESEPE